MLTTLYLHGFCSRPMSNKGRLLLKAHQERGMDFIAPRLYASPYGVRQIMKDAVKEVDPMQLTIIGSSLGGFYSTWLAEQIPQAKVVLLNPCTNPWEVIDENLGVHEIPEEGVSFEVIPEYADQLRDMRAMPTNPKRYLTFLGTADEVLDWKLGRDFYAATNQKIIEGADHRFLEFEKLVPEIMDFVEQPR